MSLEQAICSAVKYCPDGYHFKLFAGNEGVSMEFVDPEGDTILSLNKADVEILPVFMTAAIDQAQAAIRQHKDVR